MAKLSASAAAEAKVQTLAALLAAVMPREALKSSVATSVLVEFN
jgi:hypothetical protein